MNENGHQAIISSHMPEFYKVSLLQPPQRCSNPIFGHLIGKGKITG
jgi:hypothetical protein